MTRDGPRPKKYVEPLSPSPAPRAALLTGDARARDAFEPQLYDELRRIAARLMEAQRAQLTLQPTALVHEAFLRLAGSPLEALNAQSHVLALAASVMRKVLVDAARKRGAQKRGGDRGQVTLGVEMASDASEVDLVVLNDAMDALTRFHPRLGRHVELRFFGGLSHAEIARELDISVATVERDWSMAKAWLARELARGENG